MAQKTTTAEAPTPKRRRADADRSVAAILDAALEALGWRTPKREWVIATPARGGGGAH